MGKVQKLGEIRCQVESARAVGLKIAFTNGCFDLLHLGHVLYLQAARAEGDLLIVGVNSDSSVHMIKGPLRPIIPEDERCEVLASLACVDYVVLFNSPDPLPLIELIQPDVLVKGADWELARIIGAESVIGSGGRVLRVPLVPNTSTTEIIERILERYRHASKEE